MSGVQLNLDFSLENFKSLKNEYLRLKTEYENYQNEMKKMITFLKKESHSKDFELERLELEIQKCKQFDEQIERLSTAKSSQSHRSGEVNVEAMIALEEENVKLKEELEAFSYLKQENIDQIELVERQKEELEKLRRVNNSRIERTEVEADALREDMVEELIETKQILRQEAYQEIHAASRSALELNQRLAKHLKMENGNLFDCSERLRHAISVSERKEIAAEEIQQGLIDREEKIDELWKKLEEQKTIIQEMTSKKFLSEFQVRKFSNSETQSENIVNNLNHLSNPSMEMKDRELSSIWKSSFNDSKEIQRTQPSELDLNNNSNLVDQSQSDNQVLGMMKSIDLPKYSKKKQNKKNSSMQKNMNQFSPNKIFKDEKYKNNSALYSNKKLPKYEIERDLMNKKISVVSNKNPKDRYKNFKFKRKNKKRTIKCSGNLQLIGVRKKKQMYLE